MSSLGKTKKNIILQTTYQVAIMIIPFITAPYVCRVLGSKQAGIHSFTYTTVNYFMMFAMLGIENYGNRTIAKARKNKQDVDVKFTEVFYCHLIPSTVALILYLVYCFTLGGIYRIIGFIQILYVIADLLNINWLFAGLGEFKVTVVRNLSVKLLTVISIFALVRDKDDLLLYIIIMTVGTFLGQSAVWTVRHKYVRFAKVEIKNVISHLKPMSILFISVIALNIYRMIDKTMLGHRDELNILGCYEYADKIIRMPISVIVAIGVVMLSKSSNMLAVEGEKKVINLLYDTLKYITLIASLFMFGMLVFGDNFAVLYLGEEYSDTGRLLSILSFSFIFMTWNSVLRTQYFIPKCEDKSYTISVWVGAIVNIALNALLIPKYSAFGAAVATDIAYASVTITQLFFARKVIKVLKLFKLCFVPLLIGLVPTAILFPLISSINRSWHNLILEIIIFVSIFMIVTIGYWIVVKDPMSIRLKQVFIRNNSKS